MTETEMMEKLSQTLAPERMRHTVGVAQTARRLAPRVNEDPHRAYLAGLLHDCARGLTLAEMLALDTDADDMERRTVSLMHAPAGAALAAREYGVTDGAVLRAIRRHTVGGRDMSALDTLIYVADYIEPGRANFDGLEDARALADKDLYAAARLCAKQIIDYVRASGGTVHPATAGMIQTKLDTEEQPHGKPHGTRAESGGDFGS